MVPALLAGVVAGLGIAVPVGAIAVLILDLGARRGFPAAFAAGSGTASADLLYAALAAVAGGPIAAAIEPAGSTLRLISAAVLAAIAGLGLRRALAAGRVAGGAGGDATGGIHPPADRAAGDPALTRGALPVSQVYAGFLALTLLNPVTITYFAALVLGMADQRLATPGARAAFVAGAGLASWGWQSTLALAGAVLHTRITPGRRRLTGVIGSLVVLALAARVLLAG